MDEEHFLELKRRKPCRSSKPRAGVCLAGFRRGKLWQALGERTSKCAAAKKHVSTQLNPPSYFHACLQHHKAFSLFRRLLYYCVIATSPNNVAELPEPRPFHGVVLAFRSE